MLKIKISVKVEGLDRLADALFALAGVNPDGEKENTSAAPEPDAVQQPENMPVQETVTYTQTAPAPVPETAAIPATPVQPAVPVVPLVQQAQVPGAVPSSPTSYSTDDLAHAAMALMDAGKQADLQALLAKFGVESLPQLPPAHYGAFAT